MSDKLLAKAIEVLRDQLAQINADELKGTIDIVIKTYDGVYEVTTSYNVELLELADGEWAVGEITTTKS